MLPKSVGCGCGSGVTLSGADELGMWYVYTDISDRKEIRITSLQPSKEPANLFKEKGLGVIFPYVQTLICVTHQTKRPH